MVRFARFAGTPLVLALGAALLTVPGPLPGSAASAAMAGPKAHAVAAIGSAKATQRTAKITKPRITGNLKARRIATTGTTVRLRVKAVGGHLAYQWSCAPFGSATASKVRGKAGRRSYLDIKATEPNSGMRCGVSVSNAKGKRYSKVTMLLVRPTPARPFGARGLTAHWLVEPEKVDSWAWDGAPGSTLTFLAAGCRRLPGSVVPLTFAFRGSNGVLYPDLSSRPDLVAEQLPGLGGVPVRSLEMAVAFAKVPAQYVAGGRWVVRDAAKPAMTLYFKP